VRIAVLRALWSYLEREDVWDVFAKAATEDAAVARATVYIPQDRHTKAARGRLACHMELLLRHPSAAVRLETVQRLAALPISTAGTSLAASLASLLEQPDERDARHVATALALCVPIEEMADLASAFAESRTSCVLQAIVAALAAQNATHPRRVEAVSRRLVDALLDNGRHITLATRLAFLVLPPVELLTVIQCMSTQKLLHTGALMEAFSAASERRGDELGVIESSLAGADDPMARRIGLAALTAQANKLGWSQQARAKLEAYRVDVAPIVSEAAGLVFPPDDVDVRSETLDAGQIAAAFRLAFQCEPPKSILGLTTLTLNDIASVASKAERLGEHDALQLVRWLEEELESKPKEEKVRTSFLKWMLESETEWSKTRS
jgi:hypothetical protein